MLHVPGSSIFAALLVALGLSSWLPAATLTINAIGSSFVDTGFGFQLARVPANLRVGLIAGQIDPGTYRSAFEFDVRSIGRLDTIDSATLLVEALGPTEQQGRIVLTAYFGDGIIEASDVSLAFDSLELNPNDSGLTPYDVTNLYRSFANIGTAFFSFSARQDPIGVCSVSFFGSCTTALRGDNSITPTLVVNYTPFVPPPPPPPPVPEPGALTLMLSGSAAIALLRFRRR